MRDDDGMAVKHGDYINFSYGIPPVMVVARVYKRNGVLFFKCQGNHNPPIGKLKDLRRHVVSWYKRGGQR